MYETVSKNKGSIQIDGQDEISILNLDYYGWDVDVQATTCA